MIKSNGGVFGRNPTFNDVTVDGNLTVNGDIALGDDITVTDTLTVGGVTTITNATAATSTTTGALKVTGGISTQDALYTGADAVVNGVRVGRGSSVAPLTNTSIGEAAGAALLAGGIENTFVGSLCGDAMTDGDSNTAVGASALSASPQGNGNVAIGTSALLSLGTTAAANTVAGRSAGAFLTSGSNNVLIGRDAALYIGPSGTTQCTNSGESIIIGRDARPGGNTQTNQIVIGDQGRGDGSNTTVIGNTSTTSTRIPAGNLTLSNGNLILGTAGNGIDFSADANAAGMTSELLDDYEEGTWTPAYSASTTPFTTAPTMDVRGATYTKIGRQVTVKAYILTDAADNSGGTGNLVVTGLPFSATTTDDRWSAGSVSFANNFTANGVPHSMYPNGTTLILTKRATSNGAVVNSASSDLATSASADQNSLMFCITYFTA